MTKLLSLIYPAFPAGRVGLALLILRVMVGVAFVFHGYPKVTNVDGFAGDRFPLPFAWAAALSEFGGGMLLAVGLFTPVAAFFLAVTMSVAVFHIHIAQRGDPFIGGYELALVFLVANLAFLLAGPGRYSLDALLFGRRQPPGDPKGTPDSDGPPPTAPRS